MFYYTYLIYLTNRESKLYGHIYYGQHRTNDLLDNYKGSGKIIKDYYKKYPNDYYFRILKFYNSQEELNKAEYELIHPHLGKSYCLNLCEGGTGVQMLVHPRLGKHCSEELKNKISKTLSGRKLNNIHRQHIGEAVKKWQSDPAYRKKLSDGSKGKNNPMYGKNSEYFMTPEAIKEKRRKMRESLRKYWANISDEDKEKRNKKISEKLKGRRGHTKKGHPCYIKGKHRVYDNEDHIKYHYE